MTSSLTGMITILKPHLLVIELLPVDRFEKDVLFDFLSISFTTTESRR